MNPGHFPLNINLDIKGAYKLGCKLCMRVATLSPKDKDKAVFSILEREVRSVFPDEQLFAAHNMIANKYGGGKGACATMKDACKSGWPSVKDLAGKSMFVLNCYGARTGCGKVFF